MSEERRSPGIRADRIEAANVVEGAQFQGSDSAALIELARTLERGGIEAETIIASNVVSGLQFISDPTKATVDDLRNEVRALEANLATAIDAGEFADPIDAQDARAALEDARAELDAETPRGARVSRKLKEATEIMTGAAETAEATGRAVDSVGRLATVAAAVFSVAVRLLGG